MFVSFGHFCGQKRHVSPLGLRRNRDQLAHAQQIVRGCGQLKQPVDSSQPPQLRLPQTVLLDPANTFSTSLRFFWLTARPGSLRSASLSQLRHFGLGAYSATCGKTTTCRGKVTTLRLFHRTAKSCPVSKHNYTALRAGRFGWSRIGHKNNRSQTWRLASPKTRKTRQPFLVQI